MASQSTPLTDSDIQNSTTSAANLEPHKMNDEQLKVIVNSIPFDKLQEGSKIHFLPSEYAYKSTIKPESSGPIFHEPCDDLDETKHSVAVRSFAGGVAGCVEHLVIFPFDTWKVNAQANLAHKLPIADGLLDKFKWARQPGAWTGINALILPCTVAHSIQFQLTEYTEKNLRKKYNYSSFFAGAIGILPHDTIMNAAVVVKQRMQTGKTNFKSPFSVMKHIYKTEGIGAFYRSLPAQY